MCPPANHLSSSSQLIKPQEKVSRFSTNPFFYTKHNVPPSCTTQYAKSSIEANETWWARGSLSWCGNCSVKLRQNVNIFIRNPMAHTKRKAEQPLFLSQHPQAPCASSERSLSHLLLPIHRPIRVPSTSASWRCLYCQNIYEFRFQTNKHRVHPQQCRSTNCPMVNGCPKVCVCTGDCRNKEATDGKR